MGDSRESQRQRRLAFILLLAVVMVWGSTFVLVKDALQDASPLLFNLLRFALAALVLLVVGARELRRLSWPNLRGGMLAGGLLAAGYELQTMGLARTSAVHSAFITGMVVVFVPLLSFLPRLRATGHGRPGWQALLGAVTAFLGLFLLTTPPGIPVGAVLNTIGVGDLLTLLGALAFAGHLLSLARLSHLPVSLLAPLQITFCAAVMLLCLPLSGPLALHWTPRLAIALALTSLLATAGAFWVQTWAQQHLLATSTAVVVTLEPVFALGFSMLFRGERLDLRAAGGAGLILLGIVVTELFSTTTVASFEPA